RDALNGRLQVIAAVAAAAANRLGPDAARSIASRLQDRRIRDSHLRRYRPAATLASDVHAGRCRALHVVVHAAQREHVADGAAHATATTNALCQDRVRSLTRCDDPALSGHGDAATGRAHAAVEPDGDAPAVG